jgi:hypothetical protein
MQETLDRIDRVRVQLQPAVPPCLQASLADALAFDRGFSAAQHGLSRDVLGDDECAADGWYAFYASEIG